ncbi:MAG: hypothetical protein ACRET8_05605 [Burkholderiales bacterium]
MFKLWGSGEIDEFAKALVLDFVGRYPPQKNFDAAPLARAIDDICVRAKTFQREKRLGVYGKARVGMAFKFELKNAGYADDFIEAFTRQLLLLMSGK